MARKTRPKETSPTPNELRAAIAADATAIGVDVGVLRADDVGRLKRILSGEVTADYPVNLKRAWAALVRSDPSPATGELLGQALTAKVQLPRDRLSAAAYLGLLPSEAAEAPLLVALPAASGSLRLEIIKSLGQVGTAKSLAPLARVKDRGDASIARQLALSQLAIRLREGKSGVTGGSMASALGIAWKDVDARALGKAPLRQALETFRGPRFGVPLSSELGLHFSCGGKRHVVLFNRALVRGRLMRELAARSRIAGFVVAEGEKGMKHQVLRWLLITSPGRAGIDVALVRPSGEPVLAGQAVKEGKAIAFWLRDTGLERTPMEVSGKVTNNDISWKLRLWAGAVRDKARPRAIQAAHPGADPSTDGRPG